MNTAQCDQTKTCALAWLLVLSLVLAVTSAVSSDAGDEFKIIGLQPTFYSRDLIHVDSAWRKDLPKRVQVSLRVSKETPASSIFVKAYFYDKDDKLISSYDAPNKVWTRTAKGIEEVGLPATLSPTQTTNVYFAIPEDLQAKKWTTVLVVFGNDSVVTASANPAAKMPKLDFPEKSKVTPVSDSRSTTTTPSTTLVGQRSTGTLGRTGSSFWPV